MKVKKIGVYKFLLCIALLICIAVAALFIYVGAVFLDLIVSLHNIFSRHDIEMGYEILGDLSYFLFIVAALLSLIGILTRKKIGVLMSYVVGFGVWSFSWVYVKEFIISKGEDFVFVFAVLFLILFGTAILLLSRAIKRNYFKFKTIDYAIITLSYLVIAIAALWIE